MNSIYGMSFVFCFLLGLFCVHVMIMYYIRAYTFKRTFSCEAVFHVCVFVLLLSPTLGLVSNHVWGLAADRYVYMPSAIVRSVRSHPWNTTNIRFYHSLASLHTRAWRRSFCTTLYTLSKVTKTLTTNTGTRTVSCSLSGQIVYNFSLRRIGRKEQENVSVCRRVLTSCDSNT